MGSTIPEVGSDHIRPSHRVTHRDGWRRRRRRRRQRRRRAKDASASCLRILVHVCGCLPWSGEDTPARSVAATMFVICKPGCATCCTVLSILGIIFMVRAQDSTAARTGEGAAKKKGAVVDGEAHCHLALARVVNRPFCALFTMSRSGGRNAECCARDVRERRARRYSGRRATEKGRSRSQSSSHDS